MQGALEEVVPGSWHLGMSELLPFRKVEGTFAILDCLVDLVQAGHVPPKTASSRNDDK